MTQQQALKLFEEKKVRTVWDTNAGLFYFVRNDGQPLRVIAREVRPKQSRQEAANLDCFTSFAMTDSRFASLRGRYDRSNPENKHTVMNNY